MAKPDDKTAPTVEDCMKALTGLSETVTGLAEAFKKMAAPVGPADAMAAITAQGVQLKQIADAQTAFMSEQRAELAKIAKEKVALGISPEKLKVLETVADETEKVRLAAEARRTSTAPKTYLEAVERKATELKISKVNAHSLIQAENPELYSAHLAAKGIVKVNMAA